MERKNEAEPRRLEFEERMVLAKAEAEERRREAAHQDDKMLLLFTAIN
jgi:hypothetical protein